MLQSSGLAPGSGALLQGSLMTLLRRTIFVAILAAFGFGLAACENTIRGAGQDMERTGEAVERAVY